MSDTKYTIAEIEKAALNLGIRKVSSTLCSEIIAELQRPKWVPEIGEVYAYRAVNSTGSWLYTVCKQGSEFTNNIERRPLTLGEHGPAVKGLRDAMNEMRSASIENSSYETELFRLTAIAAEALKAFDEVVADE